MAAITDLDDYVARLTDSSAESIFWFRDNRIAGTIVASSAVTRRHSFWRRGGVPSGGVAPGAVAAPDRTTTGALKQTNAGGGNEKFLVAASTWGSDAGIATNGTLIVYDRLLHISGLDGTVTSPQTVGGTLTRYASGSASIGNMIFIEVYTALGTSTATITASYTNENGTSGQTTAPRRIGGTAFREESIMMPMPLASGDLGVQAVASVTLAATTNTAGDFGVTVAKPLLMVPQGLPGIGGLHEGLFQSPQIPTILGDACLAFMFAGSIVTTAERMMGQCNFIEK